MQSLEFQGTFLGQSSYSPVLYTITAYIPHNSSLFVGRLVGNIRAATTVKRTVFKGRAGVRQTGLRLPPPIQKDGVPVSVKPQAEQTTKAEPAAADGAAAGQDHTETSAKVHSPHVMLAPNCMVERLHWLHSCFTVWSGSINK